MYFVLVAGGPGTGKTTIVHGLADRFRSLGFKVYVIRDWAREIIRREKAKGSNGILPWTNRYLFELEVIRSHLEEYRRIFREMRFDIVLEDGGAFATKAYCDVDGVPVPDLYNEILKYRDRVDLVILTEGPKAYSTDNERWEDYEYALRIHHAISHLHRELFKDRIIVARFENDPMVRIEKIFHEVLTRVSSRYSILIHIRTSV